MKNLIQVELKVTLKLFFIITSLLISSVLLANNKSEVAITIKSNIKAKDQIKGYLVVTLYNAEESFLKDSSKPYRLIRVKQESLEQRITVKDVEFGEYSIAVYHDLDSNKKLNSNWLGIPNEPTGFGMNPSLSFGFPTWDETRFKVDQLNLSVPVSLN